MVRPGVKLSDCDVMNDVVQSYRLRDYVIQIPITSNAVVVARRVQVVSLAVPTEHRVTSRINADETPVSFNNPRDDNDEDSIFQISYFCFAVFYAVTKNKRK